MLNIVGWNYIELTEGQQYFLDCPPPPLPLNICHLCTVNSDLSLKISEENLSATPYTEGGFAMMWTGVRGNYGVKNGKVAFEVKVSNDY